MSQVQLAIVEGLQVVDAGLIHGRVAHQIQMEINSVHIMALVVDGVDGVQGIGTNQDNITFFAVKVVVVNMKLCFSFVDINHFNIGMPVEKNIWMTIFSDGAGQRIRGSLVFKNGIFM